MKLLPTSVSVFSNIIKKNMIYIDKTESIYKLIKSEKIYFFLSRPRRFGKSLFISTLKEYFTGNKELFKGLFIHDKMDENNKYPIIRLDFSNISYTTAETFKKYLNKEFNKIANSYNFNLDDDDVKYNFKDLIEKIHKIKNKEVVVLIDEYDKPITDYINDIKIAKPNQEIIRDLFQILKSSEEYLRFVFVTGVSKFSKTSIFSDANNFNDITTTPDYATICGYTQDDLKEFDYYIKKNMKINNLNKEDFLNKMKYWYDGYSWDGKNFLYNPYTLLNFFENGKFSNYWFESGTPKLLISLLKRDSIDIDVLIDENSIISGSFPNFDLNNLDFKTILLQSGYLTIKEEILNNEEAEYRIAIPNYEVKQSLFNYIMGYYTNNNSENIPQMTKEIFKSIISLDSQKLQRNFEILLHKIPNMLWGEIKKEYEANYKILFISCLQLLGFDITSEVMTIKGRLDAILKHKEMVLITEFKFSLTDSLDEMINDAFNQIIKKEYYKPYQNKKVFLLSVAFKSREVKCEIKSLGDAFKDFNEL
ncbi:MAG: ATP-binding protein [Methanobrevibacter sp.]|jgi:hypothetical protein|nr:ATP-binding protein [Candidatus Methanoflexus mossambicus]